MQFPQAPEHGMKYRFLGNSGLLVSTLSFGSWVTFGSQLSIDKAYEILTHAYTKGGINFFDNAEIYANGQSEVIMGQVVQRGIDNKVWEREDLVISTKLFYGANGKTGPNDQGLSRKHIIEGTKNSLKRLDMEYVDLLFCHQPDPYTPMEEIVRAMNFVIEKGWVLYWGTSGWPSSYIQEACEIAERLHLIPPLFDQPQYNIFERSHVEFDFANLYKKYKYGLTTWSPLAFGLLTGKYSQRIPEGSRLSDKQLAARVPDLDGKIKKADQLAAIAERLGCSLAQLSIAWCASNKNVSSVILGATSIQQLDENLEAIKFVDKITPEIKHEIDDIIRFVPKHPEIIEWVTRIRESHL